MSNNYGVPSVTLQDKVRFQLAFSCAKHDLTRGRMTPEAYADAQINTMTNAGFLENLSEAMEELFQERLHGR